jgi:two-component system chemotaxis response regulator CheY
MLKISLESHNFTVITAENGLKALEILNNNKKKPDLIISDLFMPNMDGYSLYGELQKRPEYRTIPIFFLSGQEDMDIKSRFWSENVSFFSKGIENEKLVSSLIDEMKKKCVIKPTILIVDDSKFIRHLIRNMLESKHFEVVGEAAMADEAVEIYKRIHPDIVTMDICMPGEHSGIDATREIVKYDAKAKVIVISSLDNLQIQEAVKAGAFGSINKPFGLENLIEIIQNALKT